MPLIVKVPWMEKLAGTVISAPVELIDIYPTAAALTRSGPVANASALDGVDFSPVLLAAAASNTAGAVAVAAPRVQRTRTFSDFPRCGEELENPQASWPTSAFEKNYCKSDATSAIFAMGYSLRSENMRYTRWMRWNGTALAVHPDGWLDDDDATPSLLGEELYDHTGDDGTDFDKFPLGHSNLAAKPAMAAQLKTHRAILASFFRDGDESVAFASADSAGPRQIRRAKADDTLALHDYGAMRTGESPPVNATMCEAESCLVSPTNCSYRAECQGCGALCFGSDPADAGWDLYLNSTGLSLQTGASNVWAGILAGGNASHPAPLDGLLRTADIVLTWNSVQPKPPPAAYDWGDLPDALERAYANGGRLMMLLWAGTVRTPSWVYDLGVEMVANSSGGAVPNYLSPKYQDLVRTVHKDLAAFLRSKAPANKAFMALQPCLGATGDDTPFHPGSYTVLDKALESRIRAAWPEYYRNMSLFLHNDAFAPEIAANQMVLLVNGEDSFPDWWVNENLP